MTNFVRLNTRRRPRTPKRTPDSYVTPDTRMTICVALREDYHRMMEYLDLMNPSGTQAWMLKQAAASWEAYREFVGRVMHEAGPAL